MIEFNFFSLTDDDDDDYYLFFSRTALFKCFAVLFNARRRKKGISGIVFYKWCWGSERLL